MHKVPHTYVRIEEKIFNKVKALNIGLDHVTDDDSIAFVLDLHLQLPIYMFDRARKVNVHKSFEMLYSETSLKRTLAGQKLLSALEMLRIVSLSNNWSGTNNTVCLREMSALEDVRFREVSLYIVVDRYCLKLLFRIPKTLSNHKHYKILLYDHFLGNFMFLKYLGPMARPSVLKLATTLYPVS